MDAWKLTRSSIDVKRHFDIKFCNIQFSQVASEEVKLSIEHASLHDPEIQDESIGRLYESAKELVGDFELINSIRHAVVQYICAKEPESCEDLADYEEHVAGVFEHKVKD